MIKASPNRKDTKRAVPARNHLASTGHSESRPWRIPTKHSENAVAAGTPRLRASCAATMTSATSTSNQATKTGVAANSRKELVISTISVRIEPQRAAAHAQHNRQSIGLGLRLTTSRANQ